MWQYEILVGLGKPTSSDAYFHRGVCESLPSEIKDVAKRAFIERHPEFAGEEPIVLSFFVGEIRPAQDEDAVVFQIGNSSLFGPFVSP